MPDLPETNAAVSLEPHCKGYCLSLTLKPQHGDPFVLNIYLSAPRTLELIGTGHLALPGNIVMRIIRWSTNEFSIQIEREADFYLCIGSITMAQWTALLLGTPCHTARVSKCGIFTRQKGWQEGIMPDFYALSQSLDWLTVHATGRTYYPGNDDTNTPTT